MPSGFERTQHPAKKALLLKLRKARNHRISLREIASKANIPEATVYRWSCGKSLPRPWACLSAADVIQSLIDSQNAKV
jgi:hypothetical protein